MLRRLAQLLLVGSLVVIPAVAQRGGHGGGGGFHGGFGGFHGGMGGFRGGGFGGFRGGGFGGFRGGFRGFRGGFFPGNRFVFGFGFPGYWPYYGAGWGWGYPYYGYTDWGDSYPYAYSYPYVGSYSYPNTYTYSNPTDSTGYASRYAYGAPAYSAPVQASCAQSNGTPLYLIKLTYQDKIWVAREYWYTPGTLNFITWQSELNKTPISTIDRSLTFQLNQECGLNFQFPK
jgi:hypothetical protein